MVSAQAVTHFYFPTVAQRDMACAQGANTLSGGWVGWTADIVPPAFAWCPPRAACYHYLDDRPGVQYWYHHLQDCGAQCPDGYTPQGPYSECVADPAPVACPVGDEQRFHAAAGEPIPDNICSNGCWYERKEDRFGALVLDEVGTWFNSRNWNDRERKPLIDWFLHARKKRWDVYFIVQDIGQVDNQARQALCEHLVVCKRLDRIPIPGLRLLAKSLGVRILFPKIHVASVFYGDSEGGLRVDRWWYRAKELYGAYDTMQCFTRDELVTVEGEVVDMRATYTALPAYYTMGHGYVDHVLQVLAERERRKGQAIRFPARQRPVPVAVIEDSSTGM